MKLLFKQGTEELNWEEVLKLIETKKQFKKSKKSKAAINILRNTFENSYLVISAWADQKMIGICRAMSDENKQSVIYDLNVVEEYHNKGVGQQLMKELISYLPSGLIMLYATPGKESYYEKFGFKKMLTAMALFPDKERKAGNDIFAL